MHTAAAILGALLVANCGFCLFYALRMHLRVKWRLDEIGGSFGGYLGQMPKSALVGIPALHAAGFSVGAWLLWWGL